MTAGKEPPKVPTPGRGGLVRRLLPVLVGLALLAVGVNALRWFQKPSLEPLPVVATDQMTRQIREMIQAATAQVERQTNSDAAWGDLGAVYFAHGMRPEAAVCFRNAERLNATDYRWPYLLGLSLQYADAQQALECQRRAAQRCGDKAHVRLRLAEALLDQGELNEAAVQIESALAHAPSNPHGQFAKARLLMAQGDLERAKIWARQSATPDKRAPHLLIAQLCRRTRDAAGEALALQALQRVPDAATTWDDPDTAAITSLRQDRMARLARAEDLAKSGETMKLKETLYEMTAGSDGSSAAAQLAWIFDQEGKNREAENLLRHQLRNSPGDERLQFMLGNACFRQEKYAAAETEFRRAIELKPDYADAWFNLSLTLIELDKSAEAHEALITTVRLSPSRVQARISLAELLLAEGKKTEALEHLEAAIKLAPTEARARELLAKAKASGK